jgi:hypothetical protein
VKEIPCKKCKRPALGPPSAKDPKGETIRFGRFTGRGMIVLKCFRCGSSFKLDELTFNGLPNAVD